MCSLGRTTLLDGAGSSTQVARRCPPDQDDSLVPPHAMTPGPDRRTEMVIAGFWGVTALCGDRPHGHLLDRGPKPSTRAGCCSSPSPVLGTGLLLWARYLSARARHRRQPGPSRLGIPKSAPPSWSHSQGDRRHDVPARLLVKKALLPVGGIFGIAAVWPLASLGDSQGTGLPHQVVQRCEVGDRGRQCPSRRRRHGGRPPHRFP